MRLVRNLVWVGCLAMTAAFAPHSHAASITAELTCTLDVLSSSGSCNNLGPFGTVTLDDSPGNGDLQLTVDLLNPTPKFRDLMLNFNGTALSITTSDGQGGLSFNGFSISPYAGQFDVGEAGGLGWEYDGAGAYTTILSGGAGADLFLSDFVEFDTSGNLHVALEILDLGTIDCDCDGANDPESCIPGQEGEGSMKIGGVFRLQDDISDVPEPSTMLLMGGALLGLGLIRKKRNS